MIGYVFLAAFIGFGVGVFITMDIIKQELKAGVVVMGRRVFKVVHATDIVRKKS